MYVSVDMCSVQRRLPMYWNAVLLMAWSLTTVTAVLDSTKSQRYWDDIKSNEVDRYQDYDMLKPYNLRGGNRHFVTSVFPGILYEINF